MSEDIRHIWDGFDILIGDAKTPELKAQIQAIKLQTQLINLRLAPIAYMMGTAMQSGLPRQP